MAKLFAIIALDLGDAALVLQVLVESNARALGQIGLLSTATFHRMTSLVAIAANKAVAGRVHSARRLFLV